MNAQGAGLGMNDTHYVEPTGLSSHNQSSAHDLATLVNAAHQDPLLRELSTSPEYEVEVGNRTLQFHNTNRLVRTRPGTSACRRPATSTKPGQCLVMQAKMAGAS